MRGCAEYENGDVVEFSVHGVMKVGKVLGKDDFDPITGSSDFEPFYKIRTGNWKKDEPYQIHEHILESMIFGKVNVEMP